ncbi:MAG: hypothetical protein RSD22_09155 [Romboutsia sp.]
MKNTKIFILTILIILALSVTVFANEADSLSSLLQYDKVMQTLDGVEAYFREITTNINSGNIEYGKYIKYAYRFSLISSIVSTITSILVGVLMYAIFKNYFNNLEKTLEDLIGKYILVGIGTLTATPIIILLLIISILGIPVGLLMSVVYGFLIYICPMVTGIILGKRVFTSQSEYIQVGLGILVVKILLIVPFINTIAWFACVLFTMGSAILTGYNKLSKRN